MQNRLSSLTLLSVALFKSLLHSSGPQSNDLTYSNPFDRFKDLILETNQQSAIDMAQPPQPVPVSMPLPPMPGVFPSSPLSVNRLPPLPITAPGQDWVIDFEDVQAYNKARAGGLHSDKIYSQWLASEKYWQFRIGKGWKGKKVMGRGGQGIVGHWRYEGADRDQKTVKDIAVKQALRSGM
jgi:hypothetical protein